MIQVIVGNNLNRATVMVEGSEATPRKVLEDNNIEYGTAAIHLDGVTLKTGEMDKTFSDLGVTEKCYLLAVVKTQNA